MLIAPQEGKGAPISQMRLNSRCAYSRIVCAYSRIVWSRVIVKCETCNEKNGPPGPSFSAKIGPPLQKLARAHRHLVWSLRVIWQVLVLTEKA